MLCPALPESFELALRRFAEHGLVAPALCSFESAQCNLQPPVLPDWVDGRIALPPFLAFPCLPTDKDRSCSWKFERPQVPRLHVVTGVLLLRDVDAVPDPRSVPLLGQYLGLSEAVCLLAQFPEIGYVQTSRRRGHPTCCVERLSDGTIVVGPRRRDERDHFATLLKGASRIGCHSELFPVRIEPESRTSAAA